VPARPYPATARDGSLQVRDEGALSFRPAGDPEVIPGGIEDPEIGQAPWAVPEILIERPACRHDPVAFTGDVVNFQY
jgi:hypothetical protein